MDVIKWTNNKGYTLVLSWSEIRQIQEAIEDARLNDDEIDIKVESTW